VNPFFSGFRPILSQQPGWLISQTFKRILHTTDTFDGNTTNFSKLPRLNIDRSKLLDVSQPLKRPHKKTKTPGTLDKID
jgi:hypothetical protein